MENKICKNCKYFILHYVKYPDGNYVAISSGHCIKLRVKKRFVDNKACTYWEEAEDQEISHRN